MNRLTGREQRWLLGFLREIYRLNEFENLVRRVAIHGEEWVRPWDLPDWLLLKSRLNEVSVEG
jgi:hypothetical protein